MRLMYSESIESHLWLTLKMKFHGSLNHRPQH